MPLEVEAIDSAWLTRALRTRAPDVTVLAFEMPDIIRGTCTKIRLRLEMDEAGKRAGIPETVFLKGGFESHSRELTCTKVEPLAYRDLLDDSGLNSPACYFADYDAERRQGIVIMEDLAARGATIGSPLRPRSQDEVARTLSMLAQFHARTWNCEAFAPGDPLAWLPDPPFSNERMMRYLVPETWGRYVAMPRGAATSVRFHDPRWAADAIARMQALAAWVPNCVVHGDTHLGNTFEAGGAFGFFDVTPRRAPAIGEVCYHITLSMDVADRPLAERALLAHYLDELRRHGAADVPSFADALFQYRAFLLEGYCLVLINDAYYMPEPLITAYAARFSAAMLDNDTAGALAAVG